MSFLIRRAGETWRQPSSSSYGNEAELQDLLATAPALIPGEEPLRVVREFRVPDVGFVDLVGITVNGDIVVVECKLRANPQIRREVVGQALAYAGGLWQMQPDDFIAQFEHKAGETLDDTLRALGSDDPSEARSAIAEALRTGDFRVVIAVDEITEELRTIVEYLNGHTAGLEVVAVELAYTKDDDIEILSPTIYGLETVIAKKSAQSAGKKWTLESIRESLEQNTTTEERALVERFLAHGEAHGHHFHIGSGHKPGMSCFYLIGGQPTSAWALYPWENSASMAPSVGAIVKRSSELALTYLESLRVSDEIAPSLSELNEKELNKYPGVPLSDLTESAVKIWLAAIDAIIDDQ